MAIPPFDVKNEVKKIIEEVNEEKRQEALNLPNPLSFNELENLELKETQWIMGRTIPWPGLIAISGRPGSYKTFLALWIGLRASAGLPLFDDFMVGNPLGKNDEKLGASPCLFIEEENTLRLIRERVLKFKRADYSQMYFYVDCGFKMTDEAWRIKTIDFIKANGVKMIVLDPFSSVMGLRDENSNAEVSSTMDIIRKDFIKQDISVIFIHHPSKGDEGGKNLRGAGDILGKCDVHLSLEKSNEDKKTITISYEKMRVADESLMADFNIKFEQDEDGGNMRFSYLGLAVPKSEQEREKLKEEIKGTIQGKTTFSKKEIADDLGYNPTSRKFVGAWGELLEEKYIYPQAKGEFRKAKNDTF